MSSEVLEPGSALALSGVLDVAAPLGTLPPLWHWVYLLERPAQDELGPEGHPRAGVPSPPAPGLARMFAGGRVRTRRPLVLGRPAEREVAVVRTRTREGRSGPLTIVTTRATITQDGAVAVEDEQDIVYRPPGAPRVAGLPGESRPDWTWRAVDVDETLLFRFSALTYNAHRIHYDVDYVRDVEGYPGLIVHGPLQATWLAGLLGDRVLRQFSFRGQRPAFHDRVLSLEARVDGAGATLRTLDEAGAVCMQAEAVLA